MLSEYAGRWFALQTIAGRERVASAILQHKAYEVFFPMCQPDGHGTDQRTAGRHRSVIRPLFPGYLFCRFNTAAKGLIVTTPGIVRIVGSGREPVPLDDAEIEGIQRIVHSGMRTARCNYLQTGQSVTIVDGPLRGLQGTFVREHARDQIVVRVHLLRRAVAVQVDARWIEETRHDGWSDSPALLGPAR